MDSAVLAMQAMFSGLPMKAAVERAEVACLQHEQVDCPVVHRFGPGIYIREVSIPADTLSIGHYQKTTHLNLMLKGRVSMLDENGGVIERKAPEMFVAPPGRKIGYIHEDMVWLNIYATPETDVEKLEETFLIKSDPWKENSDLQHSLSRLDAVLDRADFEKALRELGFSAEMVRAQSENTEDQIPFPYGDWKVRVDASPIDGKGLFATAPFKEGEIIAPARIDGKRTPAGRYINHSANPTAVMVLHENGNIDAMALRKISGSKGGYNGEEITVDYRRAAVLAEGGKKCQE